MTLKLRNQSIFFIVHGSFQLFSALLLVECRARDADAIYFSGTVLLIPVL